MQVFLVLALGLVGRLISINQSLWLDEATSALAAKMSVVNLFTKFLPGDFHPPFYYLILHYWVLLFGSSEISLRIPSIIFGLGTIYVCYLIGEKLFSRKVGLTAALFLATSGLSVYYSQEARMYSLSAFLASLLILLFIRKRWGYFSLTLLVLGLTDYVALFILPVFWLIGRKDIKKLALAHIPLVAGFLLWSPIFIKQLRGGLSVQGSNWWNILGNPTLKNMALISIKFILGRISIDNKFVYGSLVVILLVFFGYICLKALKNAKIVWAWLVVPIAIGILVSFKIPTLSYFRFLFCLPAFYLLTAYGLSNLKSTKSRIFLVVILLVNLISTFAYLTNPKFQREDWRGLTAFVESQKTPDSITIFVADSNMEAYRYYAPDAKIAGPEGVRTGYDQVWLMRYVQSVFDPSDKVRSSIESLGYQKTGEYDFNGVVVWEYKLNKIYAYIN